MHDDTVDSQDAPSPEIAEAAEETGLTDMVQPTVDEADIERALRQPLTQRITIRAGAYAWAFIGLVLVVIVIGYVIGQVSSVVIPLVIALFPAAVLQPASDRLKNIGFPPAAAAAVVLLGTIGVVTAIVTLIAPQVAAQFDSLQASIRDGYDQLDAFLASGPFGLQPVRLDDLIDTITQQVQASSAEEDGGGGGIAGGALGFARALFEGATSVLLVIIAVFFYLMDGRRIAAWVRSVFPRRLHDDVSIIGQMVWKTIGGYIQGQLMVAVVDAIFIGLGLWILGVDLALPLAVIVFFGGLFPVVGAGISGFLAALVALATNGPGTALIAILIVIGVQFLEGHLLQPLILGRTLRLHPLAIIVSLTLGGFLLGILGAFLAVPVAAASAQTVGYLRKRIPG